MAWIETRKATSGHTSYRVMWREDGHKKSEKFADRFAAARFKTDLEEAGEQLPAGWIAGIGYPQDIVRVAAEQSAAAPPKPKAPSLLTVALEHFGDKSRLTKAGPEHRMKTRRDFARHLGELGATPIDEVTRDQFQEWLDDQVEAGYAFKTIKTRRAALGAVFREWCMKHGGASPVEGTRNDGADSDFEPVFLKVWEIEAIVEQLRTEQDRVYVSLLVRTGMRKGEALALRVADLDLRVGNSAIPVDKARKHGHDGNHRIGTTKTRSSRRIVTIDDGLADMLRDFTAGRAPGELLFDLGNEGTWQNNHWAPARDRAKLDKTPRIHDLRHTHASLLLAEGQTLFQVSRRLGHSNIMTTANIYGHLDRSSDAGMADVMGKLMNRPAPVPALRLVGSA